MAHKRTSSKRPARNATGGKAAAAKAGAGESKPAAARRAGRPSALLVGRYVRFMMGRENRRLRRGWTYEPATFREANQMVAAGSTG